MDSVKNDFFEDDEPAEKIHRLFETATERGVTERALPFGAVEVQVACTAGVARLPIVPGTTPAVRINHVPVVV
jgi:hypothetical protein